jgi:hypothetical protein
VVVTAQPCEYPKLEEDATVLGVLTIIGNSGPSDSGPRDGAGKLYRLYGIYLIYHKKELIYLIYHISCWPLSHIPHFSKGWYMRYISTFLWYMRDIKTHLLYYLYLIYHTFQLL